MPNPTSLCPCKRERFGPRDRCSQKEDAGETKEERCVKAKACLRPPGVKAGAGGSPFFFNKTFLFDVDQFFKSLLNLLQYCFCFWFWFFGHEAWGSLNSPIRDRTCHPCVGRRSLNYWTTREGPRERIFSHTDLSDDPDLAHTLSSNFQPQHGETVHSCYLSHPPCGAAFAAPGTTRVPSTWLQPWHLFHHQQGQHPFPPASPPPGRAVCRDTYFPRRVAQGGQIS